MRGGRARRGRGDERQLDLLDWLDAQPVCAPAKSRLRAQGGDSEVDEDQLDLVELIDGLGRAA
ncbi:hypothetical protein [Brevundimonas sp.]|uniref:hypothetical protein n=1 Tax=Brevundimonas sp. TaxID=1871086 RepID=UPI002FC79936